MKLRRRRIWKNAPRHSAVELKEEATMADPIKTLSATLREREEEREASSLFAKKKILSLFSIQLLIQLIGLVRFVYIRLGFLIRANLVWFLG